MQTNPKRIDTDRGRPLRDDDSGPGPEVMGAKTLIGDKLFAIPWSALRLDTDAKCCVLDVPNEHLEQASGFDKDRWPSMADRQWAEEIHGYYGARPYWE